NRLQHPAGPASTEQPPSEESLTDVQDSASQTGPEDGQECSRRGCSSSGGSAHELLLRFQVMTMIVRRLNRGRPRTGKDAQIRTKSEGQRLVQSISELFGGNAQ